MEKRRIVITGMGAVTPIGNDVKTFWNNIKKGKVGVDRITRFDTEGFKAKVAAEVKEFDPTDRLDKKKARRMDLYSQFAVYASVEAMKDANLMVTQDNEDRIGVIVSSGIGGIGTIESEHTKLMEKGPKRVSPLFIPMAINNMASGNIAIEHGLKGKCITVVTACATATHSIGEAMRTIQYGEADVMLAGGAEACITPLSIAGFCSITALSSSDDPTRASIPFDKERNGFVMGEGAGVLVLEELEHAKARGAKIYGELCGYGSSCDAFHITMPSEDGSGAAKAMKYAMKDANVAPEDIQYINAHGTSTEYNDLFETRAIHLAFGEHAGKVAVNSTKSMVGHLLGAAGAVEAIVCIKSIEDGFIHENVGYKEADEECNLNLVLNGGKNESIDCVLSNSLGFGGHNSSLIFKKYVN